MFFHGEIWLNYPCYSLSGTLNTDKLTFLGCELCLCPYFSAKSVVLFSQHEAQIQVGKIVGEVGKYPTRS